MQLFPFSMSLLQELDRPPDALPLPRLAWEARIGWNHRNHTYSLVNVTGFDAQPVAAVAVRAYQRNIKLNANDTTRMAAFEANGEAAVQRAIALFDAMEPHQFSDLTSLQRLICDVGMNDEMLYTFPIEFAGCYGRGLHVYQYPNQLSRYLAWLAAEASRPHSNVSSYFEIGCRWGGNFVVVVEVLRRHAPRLAWVGAVDPIGETPLMRAYARFLATKGIGYRFHKAYSTDGAFGAALKEARPAYVFVDGNHKYSIALADHQLADAVGARYIAHHDIVSQACDTRYLWPRLVANEANHNDNASSISHRFRALEFVQQYQSVHGRFLGIGVLVRRQGRSGP